MERGVGGRLTAVEVRSKREPGRYGDGDGLYLEILPNGKRRWLLRYQLRRVRRDMSLGALTDQNGLSAARQAAQDARDLIRRGIDPIDERRRPTAAPTFAAASAELIAALSPSWQGRNTLAAWERSLLVHAAAIGRKPVNEITTADVLGLLRPRWSTQPETAGKLRARIERVLDAQRAAGVIPPPWENPARWRGHLAHMLPKRARLVKGHHPAMPYADAPAFLARLRGLDSMGARALEFAILTACREFVVISARWEEVQGDLWTIPALKMKTRRPFTVPLSPAALELLARLPRSGRHGWVFPGYRRLGREAGHISDTTMDRVMSRLGLPFVPHGFRSTFRDWAGDMTDHAREVAEEALAHQVGDETERAYRRSDALEKRRVLMEDWADYLAGQT